jgi:hypothetical protein
MIHTEHLSFWDKLVLWALMTGGWMVVCFVFIVVWLIIVAGIDSIRGKIR